MSYAYSVVYSLILSMMVQLEGMCYSHYGNGALAMFTSYFCPKLKGKHFQHPIAVMAQYIFVDFILIVFKFDTLLIGTLCPGTRYSKACTEPF